MLCYTCSGVVTFSPFPSKDPFLPISRNSFLSLKPHPVSSQAIRLLSSPSEYLRHVIYTLLRVLPAPAHYRSPGHGSAPLPETRIYTCHPRVSWLYLRFCGSGTLLSCAALAWDLTRSRSRWQPELGLSEGLEPEDPVLGCPIQVAQSAKRPPFLYTWDSSECCLSVLMT